MDMSTKIAIETLSEIEEVLKDNEQIKEIEIDNAVTKVRIRVVKFSKN